MGKGLAALWLSLSLVSCETDYDYSRIASDRVDIRDVAECNFEPSDDGWEEYTCVPVFSNRDEEAGVWEQVQVGDFDIVQREVFGAPFYQMWYSGLGGTGVNDGMDIGYALSTDGVDWQRHPYNPVLTRGTDAGSFDRDDASVGCAAFDGDAGVFHLWYTGTNSGGIGTTFGHATSPDGVHWAKDLLNPLDPLGSTDSSLSRVWGCDALYEEGVFHFWAGGITWDEGASSGSGGTALGLPRYNLAYLSTVDGAEFDGGDPVLVHSGADGDAFDAEGVHNPSVFVYDDPEAVSRYWMLYAGYESVTATDNPSTGLINIGTDGERLGMASSPLPDRDWVRLDTEPVPLDFSGESQADNPRAFFINGRVHVFFTDEFEDPVTGALQNGIGLGIAPFPQGAGELEGAAQ